MKEINAGNLRIKYFHGAAKEMPAGRYKDFQKYVFESAGIGATMVDVDKRLTNAFNFVKNDAKDKALQELHNLRMTVHYNLSKISISSYAFAVLIQEINGKKVEDYSEAGLELIVKQLEDNLSQAEIDELISNVKKNLTLI